MGKRILLIDDDAIARTLMRRALAAEGYEVRELESAENLRGELLTFAPDLVLCDLILSGQDGLSVCRSLKSDENTRGIPVVVTSSKTFDEDKRQVMEAGAAAFVAKSPNQAGLIQVVNEALRSETTVRIWGARGTIPAPEKAQGLYGGNTPCVALELPGRRRIIFDAGTGIRALGNSVLGQVPMQFHICISHHHWDHIHGLPFFKPLYVAGNDISIYGPADNNNALAEIMGGQMGREYFPISISSVPSSVNYVALGAQTFEIMGVQVSTFYAFHPGRTLAYRVELESGSLVYAPDNEIVPDFVSPELSGEALRFAEFVTGASLLIHDCTYSRQVYEKRRGWGHSCGETLAAVASHAGVKKVLLFHHDPDNSDEEVEAIHREFQRSAASHGAIIESELAREGASLAL